MNVFDFIAAQGSRERHSRPLLDWIGALVSPERADLAHALGRQSRPDMYTVCEGREDRDARQ